MTATATRTRPAIVIEDQQAAAFVLLWDSWRPSGQGSRGAYEGHDSVPIEWTYVEHDDVHPALKGQS